MKRVIKRNWNRVTAFLLAVILLVYSMPIDSIAEGGNSDGDQTPGLTLYYYSQQWKDARANGIILTPEMFGFTIEPEGGQESEQGEPQGEQTPEQGGSEGGQTPEQGGSEGGQTPEQGGSEGGQTPEQGGSEGGQTPGQGGSEGGQTPGQGGSEGGQTPGQGGSEGGQTPGQGGSEGGQEPEPGEPVTPKVYTYEIESSEGNIVTLNENKVTLLNSVGKAVLCLLENGDKVGTSYYVEVKYFEMAANVVSFYDYRGEKELNIHDIKGTTIDADEFFKICTNSGWKMTEEIPEEGEPTWSEEFTYGANQEESEKEHAIKLYFYHSDVGVYLWEGKAKVTKDQSAPGVNFLNIDGQDLSAERVICFDGTKNGFKCVLEITDDHFKYDKDQIGSIMRFYLEGTDVPLKIINSDCKEGNKYEFELELSAPLLDYKARKLQVFIKDELGHENENAYEASNAYFEKVALGIGYYLDDDVFKEVENDGSVIINQNPRVRFVFRGEKMPAKEAFQFYYKNGSMYYQTQLPPEANLSAWFYDEVNKYFWCDCDTMGTTEDDTVWNNVHYYIQYQQNLSCQFGYLIDIKNPTMDLVYQDENGKSLKRDNDNRLATEKLKAIFTFNDANFDKSKIKFYLVSERKWEEAKEINVNWRDDKDEAWIEITEGGHYSFKVIGNDVAGNPIEPVSGWNTSHTYVKNEDHKDYPNEIHSRSVYVDAQRPIVSASIKWHGNWEKDEENGWHYVRSADLVIAAKSFYAPLEKVECTSNDGMNVYTQIITGEDTSVEHTVDNLELDASTHQLKKTYTVQASNMTMTSEALVSNSEKWDAATPIINVSKDNYKLHFTSFAGDMRPVLFNNATDGKDTLEIKVKEKNLDFSNFVIVVDNITYYVYKEGEEPESGFFLTAQPDESGETWTISGLQVACSKDSNVIRITIACKDLAGNPAQGLTDADQAFMDGWIVFDSDAPIVLAKPVTDAVKTELVKANDEEEVEVSYYDTLRIQYAVTVKDAYADTSKIHAILYSDSEATKAISNLSGSEYYSFDQVHGIMTINVPKCGEYSLRILCPDFADNMGKSDVIRFVADDTAPEALEFDYGNPVDNGEVVYYNNSAVIGFKAEDPTTKPVITKYVIDGAEHEIQENQLESTTDVNGVYRVQTEVALPLQGEGDGQFDGTIEFFVENETKKKISLESKRIIVDTKAPVLDFTIDGSYRTGNSGMLHFRTEGKLTLTIEETNFDDKEVELYSNGKKIKGEWVQDGTNKDLWRFEIPLLNQEKYDIKISYKDRSKNAMTLNKNSTIVTGVDGTFQFNAISVDTDGPLVTLITEENAKGTAVIDDEEVGVYDGPTDVEIQIVEKNFDAKLVNIKVLALDLNGKEVAAFDGKEAYYASILQSNDSWETSEGDLHTARLNFDVDARYVVVVSCTDESHAEEELSENEFATVRFVVDQSAPISPKITYSIPLNENNSKELRAEKGKTPIEISATPAYYNEWIKVKFAARDDVSDVVKFTYNFVTNAAYNGKTSGIVKGEVNATRSKEDMGLFEAEIAFPAETAEEILLNGHFEIEMVNVAGCKAAYADIQKNIIIDNQAPVMEALDYHEPLAVKDVYYYQEQAWVTLKITEDNFYYGDVKCRINGEEKSLTSDDWTRQSGREYVYNYLVGIEGDYVLSFDYVDRSMNSMRSFSTPHLIVDTTNPAIRTDLSPGGAVYESNGIKYYSSDQTLVVTVTERNFDSEAVVVEVSAIGVDGRSILSETYTNLTFNDDGNDVHRATINLNTDGIYSVKASCVDLAGRASGDFDMEKFAIDKSAPAGLQVTYGTPVYETTVDGVTYGYYNGPVSVSVFASDDVSGIYAFEYRFVSASGASSVNGRIDTVRLDEGKLLYTSGNASASCVFTIPGATMNANGQLDGTLEVTAINRSMLTSELKGTKRIVADNLAPGLSVEYNSHANEIDDTWYFNEKISSTFTLEEANFFREELRFRVVKNGSENTPEVHWSERPGDKHLGEFALDQDGRYEVSISYADRSGNAAQSYRSKLMVVDTVKPAIEIKGVTNEMASNAQKIGFTVTVSDENLDLSKVQLSITGLIVNAEGETKRIDLTKDVKREESADGKNVTFALENLENDAIYTVTCNATDKAKNTNDEMITEKGSSFDKIVFSVNRNGSTYRMSDETEAFVGGYSQEPIDLVVEEINPNRLKNIRITLFKNDQTIDLKEGTDYAIQQSGSATTWYRYVYTIDRSALKDDGFYRVSFYSEDEAGNIANNILENKNVEISFGIDRTVPSVIITNVEKGVTYPVENLAVRVQATDNLMLSKTEAYLDGNLVKSWDAKAIAALIATGGDFVIDVSDDSVKAHVLKVVVTDAAGNQTESEIGGFYVTTNLWIRYVNNKPLLFGSIGGFLFILALLIFLMSRRKRRYGR